MNPSRLRLLVLLAAPPTLLGGCAAGPATAVVSRHPPGLAHYRLEVVEHNPEGTRRVAFDLRLRVAGGEAFVELLAARRAQPDGSVHEIRLPADCTGPAPGVLARLPLRPPIDLDAAVAACVPEPLFGGLTDALTFVLVQADPAFGVERLREVGDEVGWPAFTAAWHRPPQLLEAVVTCPGGTTRLEAVEGGVARYRWRPQPIDLAMVRTMGADGPRMLLAGHERLEIEIRVDARTGRLLGGRAIRDELELTLWPGFAGERVPEADQRPRDGGLPIAIRRTLQLEARDRPAADDGDAAGVP